MALIPFQMCVNEKNGFEGEEEEVSRTDQRAGVGRVRGVLLQEAGQAKVRHLADQVAVDEDVAGGQVSVDVAHFRQILHPGGDAAQHSHQLDGSELAVVELRRQKNKK